MPLGSGARLGPYEILQPLGRGGMGEVYRARHLKLRREVAIKVLPAEFAADPTRRARFEREARSASALSHPNIVTIYDIAEDHGTTYIAMELVEGRTLGEAIAHGPIPLEQATGWAEQLADGLAKAHAAGIVHRDLKPANVMVTTDGLLKILDFGLAKPQLVAGGTEDAGPTLTTETREGVIFGTPRYMSPEQCAGAAYDHRSDQFALGVVLYEMLGGRVPFDGPSGWAIIRAVLVDQPAPLRQLRPDVPAELERIVSRCLAKEPGDRFASTADLAGALHEHATRRARSGSLRAALKRPAVVAPLAAGLVVLGAAAWIWFREAGSRWAGGKAIDEIGALTEKGNLFDAYITAVRAEGFRPGDPALERVVDRMTLPLLVKTDPPGADVEVGRYGSPDVKWVRLGVTPVTLRIPYALMHWRIRKAGYVPFEGAPFGDGSLRRLGDLRLDSAGTLPPGMVHVPGGILPMPRGLRGPGGTGAVRLGGYYLDRYEVTNRQYQAFVAAGGYETERWWPTPIEGDGAELSWAAAKRRFVDATGQAGPATWEAGTYPAGRDDYPVSGISWYEAAAYCAFAGKSLPTIYHWMHAIGQDQMSDILRYSNFEGDAKAPVGQFRGLGAYGTYDMAGNVREWAWNASGARRYILGGAWNEPGYLFRNLATQDPLQREPTDGVRCAKYPEAPPPPLMSAVTPNFTYSRPTSISDREFAVIRRSFEYDHTPLDARVERVDDSLPEYRREIVSLRTAYGSGRMEVNLLVPRDVAPPYQSVIWFPGGDVFAWRSSETLATAYLFDFVPRGGRVLVYPVYKGMYERFQQQPPPPATAGGRDLIRRWSQDLSRTIDYLETRSDFDARKIAYYGLSMGAWTGPIYTAIDPRFHASILLGGGLIPGPLQPEVDPGVYAPRSHVPALMINGRDDFLMPYEESEKPLFALLGVPDQQKRLVRLDGGHMPANRLEIVREVLGWLDRWLGPVSRTRPAATDDHGS